MKPEEILFCRLMSMALHPEEISAFTEEDLVFLEKEADAIFTLAKRHSMQLACMTVFVCCRFRCPLP